MYRLLLLAFLCFPTLLYAAEATIGATPPTTRCDQSVLPQTEIGGYEIYYATQPLNITAVEPCTGASQDAPDNGTLIEVTGAIPTASATLVQGQTYYFAIRVRDTAGNYSTFSDQVQVDVPASMPNSPTIEINVTAGTVNINVGGTPIN